MRFIVRFFLLSLLAPATVHAAWFVKEIDATNKTVVIQSKPASAIVKRAYTIDVGGGQQCRGEVKATTASYAQLDMSGCPHFDRIRGKMEAEEAVDFGSNETQVSPETVPVGEDVSAARRKDAQEIVEPQEPAASLPGRFSLRLGLPLSSSVVFSNVSASDSSGSYNGEIDYTLKGGLALRADFMSARTHHWNWRLGFGVDTTRQIDEAEIRNAGAVNGRYSASGSFTAWSLNGDLFYRWNSFYLGFGGGLVSLSMGNAPAAWRSIKGGLALEGELGWFMTEKFFLGMSLRSVSFVADRYSSGSESIDLRSGGWSSFNLEGGFVF